MRRSGKFYGPMVELSRLQSELNRLFATFVESNQGGAATATSWDPNVDVMDDGQKLRILIEVPGVDAEDVRVTVRGRVLTVRGTKKGRTRSREGIRFFCMERYFGGFVKSVALPRAVNTHQAKTQLKEGLLEIVLPHVPDQREKETEIPVRAEEERRE
ncbi:MAG: Hsp20/alpha crystallin family protein [Acidobacteria bacterium]|nr:Hsp20/alpha crystallin family protein [Acidobacteriota bacterium]MCA1612107.1 Hsp20/alpha crystallin family protein [Acidobacteriota bacterium]